VLLPEIYGYLLPNRKDTRREHLKGRTFMKDYSIDIASGKENLR